MFDYVTKVRLKAQVESCAIFSNDNETKVGCVIVSDDAYAKTFSSGWNRTIKSEAGFPFCRPEKYPFMVHAEVDALIGFTESRAKLKNCILVCTHAPCNDCLKYIADSGIKKIAYFEDYENGVDLKIRNYITDVMKIEMIKI